MRNSKNQFTLLYMTFVVGGCVDDDNFHHYLCTHYHMHRVDCKVYGKKKTLYIHEVLVSNNALRRRLVVTAFTKLCSQIGLNYVVYLLLVIHICVCGKPLTIAVKIATLICSIRCF